SQRRVAEAEPEDRLIVTAAAGQGKTETVLARLEALAESGLAVQDEVLVLSFSRAAVDTVRRRARAVGLTSIPIRTFDSFAAQILNDCGELESVKGFEARIRHATEIIEAGEAEVEDLAHIIVDESQDLVGDRAELILALIEAAPSCGFTVLGDPLQGIYDFQLDGDASISKRSSADLLATLESEHGAERLELEGHYRASSDRMRSLVKVGDRLREMWANGTEADLAHEELDSYRRRDETGRHTRSGLEQVVGYFDLDEGETTAVLASTNYSVLLASEKLHELDIEHVVRRRARELGIAPWVTGTLAPLESRTLSRGDVFASLDNVDTAPDDAWRHLKDAEADRRDHRTLDVRRLGRRLRSGIIPLGLSPKDASPVSASTVHRAKGLEFDHVMHLLPSAGSPAGELTWRTLRQTYVASSRARESLLLLPEVLPVNGYAKSLDERWVEFGFRGRGKIFPRRIEVTNGDVHTTYPTFDTPEQAKTAQSALMTSGPIGKPVDLVLEPQPRRFAVGRYWIKHEGVCIGQMSE
ncbi:UvrD-helicase domain-containing protein, partial [Brachybacterium tyrofermentans]|uniref:UvrD-helicase domain-containing protein n=1 Tax=Brachybacterium tyrofermentans TaxID=47848 RepID=UPI003FD32878